MFTATEAKLTSYRSRGYFSIVEKKISDSAKKGDTACAINVNELPNGTPGMLYEISYLLIELGYQAVIDENTLNVYWTVQKPLYYDILGDIDCDDEW